MRRLELRSLQAAGLRRVGGVLVAKGTRRVSLATCCALDLPLGLERLQPAGTRSTGDVTPLWPHGARRPATDLECAKPRDVPRLRGRCACCCCQRRGLNAGKAATGSLRVNGAAESALSVWDLQRRQQRRARRRAGAVCESGDETSEPRVNKTLARGVIGGQGAVPVTERRGAGPKSVGEGGSPVSPTHSTHDHNCRVPPGDAVPPPTIRAALASWRSRAPHRWLLRSMRS
ncbi:unnamed protein product [Lampetra fluviatilis]